MILLVSKSPRSHDMKKWFDDPHVGNLLTPRSHWLPDPDCVWAADNDAYSGFDPVAYRHMLKRIEPIDGCLWVSCPDVVGDAKATLDLFYEWGNEVFFTSGGKPLALVAQDGLQSVDVPWLEIDCLFIGGTTDWKMSPDAFRLIFDAKYQGKLVHMGRVNSAQRLRYAMATSCDSVDGSSMAMFTETHLARFQHQASSPRQMSAQEWM